MQRVLLVLVRLGHDGRGLDRPVELVVAADGEEDGGDVVLAAAIVRRLDQGPRGGRQIVPVAVEDPRDRIDVDHRGEAVGAEEEDVARPGLEGERVDVDARVGAERAGDHGPLGMHLGLLRRELAPAHELGDERVVVGQLLEGAVAEHVRPRVADMADHDHAAVLDPGDGHRRPHAGGGRILVRAFVDAEVRGLDQLDDVRGAAGTGAAGVLEQRVGGDRRGDFPGLRAAHAVGDREERRLADERVLVVPALPARVRVGEARDQPHRSNLRSVSPMRTRSPGARRRSRVSRTPFT